MVIVEYTAAELGLCSGLGLLLRARAPAQG